MEIIKCMAEDIEATMDLAEDNIKQAIKSTNAKFSLFLSKMNHTF